MAKVVSIPPRSQINPADMWDLSSLYASDAAWEKDFKVFTKRIGEFAAYKGKLGDGAASVLALLQLDTAVDQLAERLGNYAFLKTAEDQANSTYQRMKGRYMHVATQASEATAWIRPELLGLPQATLDGYLAAPELADWKLALSRIIRYKPHTLSDREEQLLAMSGQMAGGANQIFSQLNDSDLKWGVIKDEKNVSVELGHSSFSKFLQSPSRRVRKEAFHAYYAQFEAHKNTLAASYHTGVQRDVFYARARGYESARASSLFADNVPVKVYDSLINAVHKNFPAMHRYIKLRQKALKLKAVHMYDTYVPLVKQSQQEYPWDQAVRMVTEALAPLGTEYTKVLQAGLTSERWCDRYPNQGKRSGAFSSGGFAGKPYILMNYQPTVLDHVFTLAHEAGHSMHTYYSARSQPYQYYGYTIFVAEVASTFNEQLLLKHLLDQAKDRHTRALLINHAIDEIRGTVIRQTMFAEFETISHELVEKGEPLTVECLRKAYRGLLEQYFGPGFVIDPELELECLRIPHFYNAFYVYKYATGLSAAVALSQRVLKGGPRELDAYLGFLRGGCSQWPLDLLRSAGVDMEKPGPVNTTLAHFGDLVDELDELIG